MSPCMRSLQSLYFNHRVIENFEKNILFWCRACVWVLSCHSVDYLKKSAQFSTLFCPCKYILGLKRIKLRSHSPYSPSVFISQISNKKNIHIPLSENPHSSPRLLKSTSCPSHTFWPTLRFPLARARPGDVWNVTR